MGHQIIFIWFLSITVWQTSATSCSQLTSCKKCNTYLSSTGIQNCAWCVGTQSCVPNSGLECVFSDKITKADDCPLTEPPGIFYNDTFARNEMFAISAGAYFNETQKCMDNFIPGTVVRLQVFAPCAGVATDHCSAFTAVSTSRRAIILGFRGTDTSTQLFVEGWQTVLEEKVSILGGGQVSKYFYNAFNAVWKAGISDDFMDMVHWFKGYELWISGHSLGGAIASVASEVIAYGGYYDPKKIKLVTFGQPRTGDHDFVAAHDNVIPYTYRVTHRRDMVAHLPSRGFRNYHHHRYEVWYDNDMTEGSSYIECYTPDDDSCSDFYTFDTSVEDHQKYFNKAISMIGKTGCI